jgi:hypothetical protein
MNTFDITLKISIKDKPYYCVNRWTSKFKPNENEIEYNDEMATVIYYNVTRYMIENLVLRINRCHLKNEIEIISITDHVDNV